MGNQARAVLEAARALPKDERADLTEKLLASVEDGVSDSDMFGEHEPDPDVEKAWAAEIVYVELETEVLILAVAHARRRPTYWHPRDPEAPSPNAPRTNLLRTACHIVA